MTYWAGPTTEGFRGCIVPRPGRTYKFTHLISSSDTLSTQSVVIHPVCYLGQIRIKAFFGLHQIFGQKRSRISSENLFFGHPLITGGHTILIFRFSVFAPSNKIFL